MDNRLLMLIVPLGIVLGAALTFVVMQSTSSQGEWGTLRVDVSGMAPSYTPGVVPLDVQEDAYETVDDVSEAEVVVYESAALDRYCLARVIAGPGSRVEVAGRSVKVDGRALVHDYLNGDEFVQLMDEHHGGRTYPVLYDAEGVGSRTIDVGKDSVFLLPDSRTSRRESCYGGEIQGRRLKGRVE